MPKFGPIARGCNVIIVQVVRSYNNVRKLKVYRVCGDDKVDITIAAGRALGARVDNGILHWGLEGVSLESLERLVQESLK